MERQKVNMVWTNYEKVTYKQCQSFKVGQCFQVSLSKAHAVDDVGEHIISEGICEVSHANLGVHEPSNERGRSILHAADGEAKPAKSGSRDPS